MSVDRVGRIRIVLASAVALVVACGSSALAQEAGDESLSQAADDPTASLMSFQLNDWYTSAYWHLPGETSNSVVLRSAIPFSTGSLNHIFRVTAPIITDSPFAPAGLSDSTVFDLIVFNERWGRWGVGPVALLPTGGSERGAEQWAIGPAIGFTAPMGPLLVGLFNQNLFTVAGNSDREPINVSILQPILNYSLGSGWGVGASEMSITYDWDAGRWASLPLGFKVGKLTRIAGAPVQFSFQYEHDFADDQVGPKDTLRFNTKLLMPTR